MAVILGVVIFEVAVSIISIGIGILVYHHTYVKNEDKPLISFTTFQNLYAIAPDKWQLFDEYIRYDHQGQFDWLYQSTDIYFKNWFEQMKYKNFLKKKRKNKNVERRSKNTQVVAEQWVKDIENYRKKSQSEVKELARKNELERAAAMKKFYDAL